MKKFIVSILLFLMFFSPAISAEFSYNDNTQTLTLVGDIVASDYFRLSSALAVNDVKYLKMTSRGGDFSAGLNMGLLIKEYNVGTVASAYCHSSCAYMWLAGQPIMYNLDDIPEVGIHMPALVDNKNTITPPDSSSFLDVGFYIGKILGNYALAEAISKTPYESLLYFTPDVAGALQINIIPWKEHYGRLGR